jgi:hypothetical protein
VSAIRAPASRALTLELGANRTLIGRDRTIERPRALDHPLLRGAVAHEDVHLVGVPAKENVRRSAPPGEALKARSVDRY